ncbi:MAG TPA: helix-turn-helix transcriptional regulator [Clostridiales bacterium]|jgi:AraC-like DNA-binding protein|nr:helix-turn-helix transcriptional regulator [Clostridiales bacterium]
MKKWIPCNVIKSFEIKALYTAFEITFDNRFSTAGEIHNFFEVICVLDGKIGIASDMNVYSVPGNRLVIHKPMEFHRIWSEEETTPSIIIISFDADTIIDISGTVFELSDDEVKAFCGIYRTISGSCKINMRRVTSILPGGLPRLQTAVNSLENLLLGVIGSWNRPSAESSSSGCAVKYREIMKFLSDNVNARLCIEDVARACGMSASGAKQIFHRYTGQGIMRYFRDLKVKKAITLLNSGCSVKETALQLGFSDQNYFSTYFKRMTGKSPRAYIAGN